LAEADKQSSISPHFREASISPHFREGLPHFREATISPHFREGLPHFREGLPHFREASILAYALLFSMNIIFLNTFRKYFTSVLTGFFS